MITASIFSNFWENLVQHEEQGFFLVLCGFLLSFAFIRTSARLMRSPKVPWWPGSVVSDSGVHLHHLVWGIVTMMIAGSLGFLAFGRSPHTEIFAFFFGVGAGLTIDEFALWVHLEDVYWAEEGRSSIDAVVIAAAAMFLVLLGYSPVAIESGSAETVIVSVVLTAVAFSVVAVCFFKGRVLHGVVGAFIFPVAIYGACRIGKPRSPWARHRYGERNPKKQAKAEDRFAPTRRTERFKEAFRDVVGGRPEAGAVAARDEAIAATREASEEVRQRAEKLTNRDD
jgi:hypothetical protein